VLQPMFRRLLLVMAIALVAAIALMIGRSVMVPTDTPAQSAPPMDSDEKQSP
jgi:hypothetical protein